MDFVVVAERLARVRRLHHLGDASGVLSQRADVKPARAAQILMQRLESGEVLLADGKRNTELACQIRQSVQIMIGDGIFKPVEVQLFEHPADPQRFGQRVRTHRIDHQVELREFVPDRPSKLDVTVGLAEGMELGGGKALGNRRA